MRRLISPLLLLLAGVSAGLASFLTADSPEQALAIYSLQGKLFVGACGVTGLGLLLLLFRLVFGRPSGKKTAAPGPPPSATSGQETPSSSATPEATD